MLYFSSELSRVTIPAIQEHFRNTSSHLATRQNKSPSTSMFECVRECLCDLLTVQICCSLNGPCVYSTVQNQTKVEKGWWARNQLCTEAIFPRKARAPWPGTRRALTEARKLNTISCQSPLGDRRSLPSTMRTENSSPSPR